MRAGRRVQPKPADRRPRPVRRGGRRRRGASTALALRRASGGGSEPGTGFGARRRLPRPVHSQASRMCIRQGALKTWFRCDEVEAPARIKRRNWPSHSCDARRQDRAGGDQRSRRASGQKPAALRLACACDNVAVRRQPKRY